MGGMVRFGVAMADNPEGPYLKTSGHIFEAAESGNHKMVAEDPFIWFSQKYGSRYYAVARDVIGTFSGASGGICMFQSEDGLNWQPSAHPKVLGNTYTLDDGTTSSTKIERPSLLFEDGEPVYLFGAADGYPKSGVVSTNVQFPIAPAR